MKEGDPHFEGERIELGVREPLGDKGFMIFFEALTRQACAAYNRAIQKVVSEEGWRIFHQVGATPTGQNEPGYHAWEIYAEITRERLEALLPQIEAEAQALLPLSEELGH